MRLTDEMLQKICDLKLTAREHQAAILMAQWADYSGLVTIDHSRLRLWTGQSQTNESHTLKQLVKKGVYSKLSVNTYKLSI